MRVNKTEMLRYLGHRGQEIGDGLNREIDRAIEECESLASPRAICRVFDLADSENGISIKNTPFLLTGKDIARHLKGADKAALLAATLGIGVDNAIGRYSRTDISYSLLLDAAATALVESFCDAEEEKLRASCMEKGLQLTSRFSPGYGDLPIEIQPAFLDVVEARRIGLTCTPGFMLVPGKSVTAIMGIGAGTVCDKAGKCENCALSGTCEYKRVD